MGGCGCTWSKMAKTMMGKAVKTVLYISRYICVKRRLPEQRDEKVKKYLPCIEMRVQVGPAKAGE